MVERGRQGTDQPGQLLISIDVPSESDAREVEELTRRLRSELLRLDVESVSPLPGPPAPEGAKAGDAVAWSTLVLTLAASGGVVTTVISALRDWLVRQPAPAVIEVSIGGDSIRLEGSSTKERQRLIEAFLARHDREPA
jgi:Effector Associated Constant Component 1